MTMMARRDRADLRRWWDATRRSACCCGAGNKAKQVWDKSCSSVVKRALASRRWSRACGTTCARRAARTSRFAARRITREAHGAQDQAEATIALATEHTLPQYVALGRFMLGWALAAQGQGEEGVTLMRQGVTDVQAIGSRLTSPQCLPVLAEASGTLGQVDAGVSIVAEALELVEQTGVRWYEAETYCIQGTVLRHQAVPDAAQAEAYFQRALDIACRQEATSWELRAATSLARLWQSQGKRQDAYDLLAPVYDWFTEGFDTADLKEARSLVDELRPEKMPPMT
jgi:predicted ATPase